MNKLQFQIIQIKIVIVKQSISVGLKKKKLNIILYTISIQFYNFSRSLSLWTFLWMTRNKRFFLLHHTSEKVLCETRVA